VKRIWVLGVALLGIAAALARFEPRERPLSLVIGGDLNGYLSPCGCSKPMTGGIRRRAFALAEIRKGARTVVVENTGLVKDGSPQERMKLAAALRALERTRVDVVHWGETELRLGEEETAVAANLLGDRLLCETDAGFGLQRGREASGLWIGIGDAAEVARGAAERKMPGVLLLDGNLEKARAAAREAPALRVIVYRQTGEPTAEPLHEGEVWLVTPGARGKHLVEIGFESGRPARYVVHRLGPQFGDHAAVSKIFALYLEEVDASGLIDRFPRTKSEAFAGTAACMSCHQDAGKVWNDSAHAQALLSLERDGHGRDPECVPCHVVGLDKSEGFRSRKQTPELANVGCESCHGPGGAHASQPAQFPMGKVGEKSCAPCHVPDHSPAFDFATYWKKIAH
jgi:hypothetical protein